MGTRYRPARSNPPQQRRRADVGARSSGDTRPDVDFPPPTGGAPEQLHAPPPSSPLDLSGAAHRQKYLSLARAEWEYIQYVLRQHDGNVSETARTLRLHRRSLQRKLQRSPPPSD